MASKSARRDDKLARLCNEGVVLVVHAPFGTDETLSTYPDGSSLQLMQHPLVRHLLAVAKTGVGVCALIDRVGHDTMLLEVPGGKPSRARLTSCWKQDMASPRTLAGLLRRAHACFPKSAIVLSLEGHGAGYLPEIDRRQITHRNLTGAAAGPVTWQINPAPQSAPGDPPLPMGAPILPMGAPILPMGAPILPMGAPILPSNHLPLSTWGLGEALRLAREEGGVPRIAVVHLNNCFNLSAELLHTLMPHADHASAYGNYNFFTAGEPYPRLFQSLAGRSYTAATLARGFARGNGALLKAKGNHPSVGGSVALARMADIADKLDRLAGELVSALTGAGAGRAALAGRIEQAIVRAQSYDSDGSFTLEMPDQLTDLMGLAAHLQDTDLAFTPAITGAAAALQQALAGIWQYGERDRPWLVPDNSPVRWDFTDRKALAMNILLPDPDRRGLWDWRSPFYLNITAETDTPRVQPHVIDFLKSTDWVDFLIEYHRDVAFKGLLPALIPEFPVFKTDYKPGGNTDGRR